MSEIAKKKVPAIRFKGFDGEWEENKFGNLVLIQRGGSPRPIEAFLTHSTDGINWVKIGDVSSDSRYINKTKEKIKPEGVSRSRQVFKGDLILSNSMSFGRPYIMNIDGCIHDGWLLIRNEKNIFDLEFLLQLLSSEKMLSQYRELASGGVVNNLNSVLVQSTLVIYPKKEEQEKNGTFFKQLDASINLHQTQLNKLQNLKQAMLQKMFPQGDASVPEIRFKGFSGEWKQGVLENLASFAKGKGYSKSDLRENGTPIVLYGRLYTNYQTEISKIDTFVQEKENSVKSKGGEVIIPASGETAEDIARASSVLHTGIILGGDLNIIFPHKALVPYFLSLTISNGRVQRDLAKKAQGKSVVHIGNKDLQPLEINYPDIPEQQKISDYFRKLDELIFLQEVQLEKLKQIKQACLAGMFV